MPLCFQKGIHRNLQNNGTQPHTIITQPTRNPGLTANLRQYRIANTASENFTQEQSNNGSAKNFTKFLVLKGQTLSVNGERLKVLEVSQPQQNGDTLLKMANGQKLFIKNQHCSARNNNQPENLKQSTSVRSVPANNGLTIQGFS